MNRRPTYKQENIHEHAGKNPVSRSVSGETEAGKVSGDEAALRDPPAPSAAQLAYLKTGVMGIIHYGLNTYVDREWGYGDTPPSVFNPKALDAEQWVVAAKRGGLRRLIMVAKHHDGFCLFPSKLNTDYTVANTPWKDGRGDLVREVRDACLKHGLEFGVYLSPWDRRRADYATPAYVDYFHGQWDEVFANYGPIIENWLDGANGGDGWYGGAKETRSLPCAPRDYYRFDDLLVKLAAHNPNAVSFGGGLTENCVKWIGNEKGFNADTRWNDEHGPFVPYEADTPFRKGGWFWHPGDRAKSLAELVEVYFLSVGRGAVLNLGLAPNRDGLLDEGDVTRLAEFGDWVRKFEATDLAADARREECRTELTLAVTMNLPKPATFNAVDFGEDLSHGQQIEDWTLQALQDGVWTDLVTGTTAGFRRMERFPVTTASAIRLTCRGRTRVPSLTSLALRFADAVPEEQEPDTFDQRRSPCKVTEPVRGTLEFDFLRKVSVNAFHYIPVKDRFDGVPDQYELYVSDDGKAWTKLAAGEFGNLRANPVMQRQQLPETVTMRYARVKATRALEGEPTWSGALFEFFTLNTSTACRG